MAIKIGLIGAALGHPKTFTAALRAGAMADVVGLWTDGGAEDAESARATQFCSELNLRRFADRDELLRHCDAVIITTPTCRHAAFAVETLASGKPTFVDKPIATTLDDAAAIVRAARDAGVPMMSCSMRRYTPAFRTIADACRNGDIGLPISVSRFEPHGVAPGDWQDRVATSGGLIFNFGIHCVDSLQAALGRATRVFAVGKKLVHQNVDSHDAATITIEFASGAVGFAEVIGAMTPGPLMATAPCMRAFATENSLEARLVEHQTMQYSGGRYGVHPCYRAMGGADDMMAAFVAMAETGEPAIAYDDMLEVAMILEAARTSAQTHATVELANLRTRIN